eukprot:6589909-Pyramimonas_sp.AAC.1
MAAARRAQIDQALNDHADRIVQLELTQRRHSAALDALLKSTVLIVEGFPQADVFYLGKKEAGAFRELKEEWPNVVCKEVAERLDVTWPLDDQMGGGNNERTEAVRCLYRALSARGLIVGVYEERKWSDAAGGGSGWQRLPGVFKTRLRFCTESLLVQSALGPLDKLLRTACGLDVDGRPTRVQGVEPPPRRLLYLERTPEERGKGKGGKGPKGGKGDKGKGKAGKGGKGKGKAKGKKGAGAGG